MLLTCILHLKSQQPWIILLTFLGFLLFLKHSISLLQWLFVTFLRPPKNLKTYGSWALVTGATDGIGKSFAHELAGKGLNLILVSRNPNNLKKVSTEIQSEFPNTQIKIVALNFTGDLITGVRLIEEAIKGLDVGVLINNVGITSPARYFHEIEEKVWRDIVRVNLEGTTRVTKSVLAEMVKKRKGAIVNISSAAASVVPPLSAIYASSKAYVDQFSRCLHVEYKHFGIDVQCQVPLYVATKMVSKIASIEKSSLFIPSSDTYARAAIRRIGYEPRCIPYWAHAIQLFFVGLLPRDLVDSWVLSIGIRRRGNTD